MPHGTVHKTMDLPFDAKEHIASYLSGHDLAVMCSIDNDFRPFFMKKVAPVFMKEIKNISKILKYLQNICTIAPTSNDIMEDGDDSGIMSRVLERCVEPGELFESETEYYIWLTLDTVIDVKPSIEQVLDEFIMFKNGWHNDRIVDDYNYDLKYAYMGNDF